MEEKTFLGTGWSFPPTFRKEKKSVSMVEGELDVRQSLEILISTSLGERVLRSDYGCGIKAMSFESMTVSMMTKLERLIEKAILKYETRIDLENVSLKNSVPLEGILYIQIQYRVRTTNSRTNFVYPFYIREGSLIEI